MFLIHFHILFLFFVNVEASELDKFQVSLRPNNTDKGSMTIDWSSYDCNDKIFKVYRSKDNENFETISIDYTQVQNINCLHVYPNANIKDQLKKWMSDIKNDIINVTSITIEAFNSAPETYLKQYDVVFFGTYDMNGNKDLIEECVQPLKDYIKSGKGVIFGHDTFWVNGNPDLPTHYNFNKFAEDAGIIVYQYGGKKLSTEVTIAKEGLLTTYPNYLDKNKKFIVPETHISSQEVFDINNVNFFLHTVDLESRPNRSFYVTTKNNVGFIQTGHTYGQATDDEKKIIANLIFYCYQLVVSNGIMTDNGALDESPPTKPKIVGTYGEYGIFSEDEGTQYYYYVESYNKDNTTSGSHIGISSTVNDTITTGISKYCYTTDHNEDTEITHNNINSDTLCSSNKIIHSAVKNGYLHVCTVDNAGNISPTSTIRIKYTKISCDNKRTTFFLMIKFLSLNIFIVMFNK